MRDKILLAVGVGIFLTIILYPYDDTKVLVLAPTLTANAYAGGFYDYFEGNCDESCLTVQIDPDVIYDYKSSSNALILLGNSGYGYDIRYDTDMFNVNDYDTLVVLHNEYVTQELFDAITSHPNVYYLYPNALYGLVEVENNTMTLISGHGVNGKDNAFDWEHENTRPAEFDSECINYSWGKVSNGYQLNCYPENAIQTNDSILEFIR